MFGLVVGVAAGAFYAPLMAVASGWFEHNRSLAVALVSAGMGVAPLTVAPFARWLITTYEWRPAMMVVGIVATILMVPAALLVRRPPVVLDRRPAAPGVATPVAAHGPEPRMSAGEALRTPQFAALALAHFACCAAHSGPIFHMVAFALGCGLPAMVAVSVYSLAGFSGLGGRLLLGVLADRLGAKQVLVAGLMVQAMAAGAYLFVRELGELYALSVVFGIAYGGVMPLYAILAREYFGAHIMGTVFGAISALASLGMAFGPWAGGWVFDTYASYSWLYIGSFSIGLAAVAVALTFKPVPAAAKLRWPPDRRCDAESNVRAVRAGHPTAQADRLPLSWLSARALPDHPGAQEEWRRSRADLPVRRREQQQPSPWRPVAMSPAFRGERRPASRRSLALRFRSPAAAILRRYRRPDEPSTPRRAAAPRIAA